MNLNQILDEQMREFDERLTDGYGFLKDKMFIRDGGTSVIKEFRSFIHSYTRKLIESLAEEIINVGKPENDDVEQEFLRAEQRLKVKEIITNLK